MIRGVAKGRTDDTGSAVEGRSMALFGTPGCFCGVGNDMVSKIRVNDDITEIAAKYYKETSN
jgi:hypothetical protein